MPATVEQLDKNRAIANTVRMAIAETRAAIRASRPADARVIAVDTVRHPAPGVERMRVGVLIAALPSVGRDSPIVSRVLRHVGLDHDVRICELTDRQRDALAAAISLPRSEQLRLQPQTQRLGRELATLRRRHERAIALLRTARGADVRLAEHVLRELGA